VKIASVALNLTGLDRKRSFFQAMSAFTGTGFTTRDSELIVNNDIRRGIIMVLMILGNAGLISVISTLMLSFIKADMNLTPILINIGIILLSILLIIRISMNQNIIRKLTKKIQNKLVKSATFAKRPVEEVLHLAAGYGVAEVTLGGSSEELGKTLFDSSFRQQDILIMAIERGSTVIPAPNAQDKLLMDDTLICYGKLDNIKKISEPVKKS
jgi:hypothetical protein